jgi:hypothetical protein
VTVSDATPAPSTFKQNLPLASFLVLPLVAYAVGWFALPQPAPVSIARAKIDRASFEGEVLLKQSPTPKVVANANYNNMITVLGLDSSTWTAGIGERVNLTFYYRCEAEMQESWRIFLHVDAKGAQYRMHGDHDPPRGYSTDKWRKGDIIADRYTLWVPLDATKGVYDIWMGFYDPAHEDERLALVPSQPGVTTDGTNRIQLGTLTVR